MIPMSIENATPSTIAGTEIATGVSVMREMTCAMMIPTMIPRIPPSDVRAADSVRNCMRIRRFRAPSAFFKPISLVRSVTETSMMFMTPMPPTSSAIEATQMSSRLVLDASSCLLRAFSSRSSAL